MSLCPTKDIHSVYLDDELPLSYIREYEIHIQNCPKCKIELENLKALRYMLNQDNDKTKLSKKDLDEGFSRLQMKMNFKKHTRHIQTPKFEAIKYAIPAMAAAAVFALVLPIGLNTKKNVKQNVAEAAQITNGATVSLKNESVVLSGNIPSGAVITATPVKSNHQKTRKNMIQDVDVFRPNFDNENTISIKITVPGINANPYTTEIDLPVDLYKGYFE